MKIEKITSGNGASPKSGDTVTVHYTGWLTDGTKFDSSVDRDDPFAFVLGAGQVIRGWDEGVASLKVGDKARFTIPPDKAYGPDGYPGAIPPNATLIFEVELLSIS
ncbi:MAG: peptidylprolyl isomerase [Pedosphaera sp.]|nr:peptidylprolyl isomerase [Pedosphaera sp.]